MDVRHFQHAKTRRPPDRDRRDSFSLRTAALGLAIAVFATFAAFLGVARADSSAPPAAQPSSAVPPIISQVGFDQKMGQQVPADLQFRDETGKTVRLGDYFAGKPIILTLNYYNCPNLCELQLTALAQGLSQVPYKLGGDYQVVTVSIDPRETPQLASEKKVEFKWRYNKPGADEGWHFLTGSQEAITQLTQAVGFRYAYDAQEDQYAHPAGVMALTPEGKISRYLFGLDYPATDLRLALLQAGEKQITSITDRVLLFCYSYEPSQGKYNLAVLNLVRAAGALTVLTLGTFMVVMFRRDLKQKDLPLPPEDGPGSDA